MSRPIKETPILKGTDAVRFKRNMNNIAKLSKEKLEEMRLNFYKIQSIEEFK